MSKYVLITYYNRGTEPKPHREVYGHVNPGINYKLGTFKTESEAQWLAFGYGVPVIRGSHGAIEETLKRLTKDVLLRANQ